jgi:hypothetical protein
MADVGHRMIVLHQYVHNNLYSDSGSLRYKTDYKARLSYVSCLYLLFLMRGNGKVIGRRKKVGDIGAAVRPAAVASCRVYIDRHTGRRT